MKKVSPPRTRLSNERRPLATILAEAASASPIFMSYPSTVQQQILTTMGMVWEQLLIQTGGRVRNEEEILDLYHLRCYDPRAEPSLPALRELVSQATDQEPRRISQVLYGIFRRTHRELLCGLNQAERLQWWRAARRNANLQCYRSR